MNQRARAQHWYASWFDTPYYHLLYKHRDEEEAASFIRSICQYLSLPAGSKALDLACGKGRHARVMAREGLEVTGLDLSPANIASARSLNEAGLHFELHDMREVWKAGYFDVVFNLFTSFGYFDDPADDMRVLRAIYKGLKPGGLFVFDYLHSSFVAETYVPREEKVIDDIHFYISRHITPEWIVKQINFEDGGESYRFFEQVRNHQPGDLAAMLEQSGFHILRQFGDYQLQAYEATSPRCIFVAQKP